MRHVATIAGGAEQAATARDRHGRVPSSANPLVAAGLERRPVVTEAATALRIAVTHAAERRAVGIIAPWPNGSRWAAAVTHDVDVVAGWPLFTALRVAELLTKGQGKRAARATLAAATAAFGDPAWEGSADVLAREGRRSVVSTWFFLCGTPTLATWRAGDLTYRPESPAVRRLLDAVLAAGGEIGLHGSFATYDDDTGDRFAGQRERLATLAARPVTGVRQHYLRLRPEATPRAMHAGGFRYDATYGFADRNGFRLGSANVVPALGAAIDEVPLVWMDRALSKYRGIEDPNAWIDDAASLAAAARAVDGLWVGLWHCNLTPALGYPGAPDAYERLLALITAERPWIATMDRIVSWRRARRAVRATTVAPDGRCVLTDHTIVLER